jgi:AcrR family transcriptional regulator
MTTYHHGDLRAALVRAGSKLLEKRGLSGLSLREAARRAGVSHNAPYRHFPDRESLLAAIAAEGFAMLGERLKGRAGREKAEAYVRFAIENPQRFRLMSRGGAAATRAYEELVDVLSEQADPKQARVVAAAAWSLAHGLSHLILDGHFAAAQRAPGGTAEFARQVLKSVRYRLGAQRSA